MSNTTRLLVDADACPVKDEIYRVGARYGLKTIIVANSWMNVPQSALIERVVVPEGPDVADDWIAEQVTASDIVITSDIPLAVRCLAKKGSVLRPNGEEIDERSVGMVSAMRDLMQGLRETGMTTYNPSFSKNDRSRFLSALDTLIVRLRRKAALAQSLPSSSETIHRAFPGDVP
ncbi:YaiI/YqxD family protein [Gluconobacter kondonii]|uniref:YaiI/YqxD family protein n=1 Tax=Gluconobacter kondonii TaxID=941463 RepID=UPI001B8AD964|nr:YaiI/YqxD family protein [Gluconobacter kondonii]MBS1080120.1 YaiI/YqxD family protein [Gluconobacter kondonii]